MPVKQTARLDCVLQHNLFVVEIQGNAAMTTDFVDLCTPFLVEVQTNVSYCRAAHA